MRTTTSMKHSDERSSPDEETFRASARQGPPGPGLLVSVRNAAECDLVLDSPTPWIDLKEPSHGSLGRPDSRVALDVYERIQRRKALHSQYCKRHFSVAMGEWLDSDPEELTQFMALFGPDVFFKIALAHCDDNLKIHDDIVSTEKSVNRPHSLHSPRQWKPHLLDWATRLDARHQLILCCYADRELAGSPSWEAVVELSAEIGCRYVLVDTYSKAGSRLLDWCSLERLAGMLQFAHTHRLQVAVAGSLRIEDFPSLRQLPIAWIGVRGAVCDEADRTGKLCRQSLMDANSMFDQDNLVYRQSEWTGGSNVLR